MHRASHLRDSSSEEMKYEMNQQSIGDLIARFDNGHLNLEPGFQRRSVWSESDRKKLIDSILRGYPLPAIFLHKSKHAGGELRYDVLDGKQRIESILGFARCLRGRSFYAKVHLPGEDAPREIDYRRLIRERRQALFTGYKLLIIEVEGSTGDIIDLFVKINSTGKALTSQEKRHAKHFSNSAFLSAAARLAERLQKDLVAARVLTPSQVERMKHVELISELMLSIMQGDVINKKSALDKVMSSKAISSREVTKAEKRTYAAVRRCLKMFPKLKTTRFAKVSDFYTLVVLLEKLHERNFVLNDRRRNRLAWDLLTALSIGVDDLNNRRRGLQEIKDVNPTYRDYALTVSESTDSHRNRQSRQQILLSLLESLFERKDERRLFSVEQRRLLWNTTAEKRCEVGNELLTWENFTIDHVDPWDRGGRSELSNAALYCRRHNSAKGNRRLFGRKRVVRG